MDGGEEVARRQEATKEIFFFWALSYFKN